MLKNKLGITNEMELAKEEERISKIKAKAMLENDFFKDRKPEQLTACWRFIAFYLKIFMTLPVSCGMLILQKEVFALRQPCIYR